MKKPECQYKEHFLFQFAESREIPHIVRMMLILMILQLGILAQNTTAQDLDFAFGIKEYCEFDIFCASSTFSGDITVDGSNNFYVTGGLLSEGAIRINLDPDRHFILGTTKSSLFFLAKYDSNGKFDWAIPSGFMGTLSADDHENVYGISSSRLAKYDSEGSLEWQIYDLLNSSGVLRDIVVDNDAVYVTGNFSGTVDFDPGDDTFELTSLGDNDVFVSKYDGEGHLVFAFNVGSIATDFGHGITIGSDGNIYVSGIFTGTVDFDSGPGVFELTSIIEKERFVAKYTSTGLFESAFSTGDCCSTLIALDGSGNIYTGAAETLIKRRRDGREVWKFRLDALIADVAVDSSGYAYITGSFTDTTDFDPGQGVFTLSAFGSDAFFAKYAPNGRLVWAHNVAEYGAGIALDNDNNVLVTGSGKGGDYDPSDGISSIPSVGGDIFYAAKYSNSSARPAMKNASVDDLSINQSALPESYALTGNYPNPFNPVTTIHFSLPESANIQLSVYDMLGRNVKTLVRGMQEAGNHEVVFEAGGLPSGTYLYRLETPKGSYTQTMLLLK